MQFRSFFVTCLSLVSLGLATLTGCQNMQNFDPRQAINIASGVGGAALCYQLVGGGNMRLVSGAACGAGAYFLADWIQNGTADRNESARVQSEYQRALTYSPANKRGAPFTIDTKTNEGYVRISMLIFPIEQYAQSATQCRSFSETISVNNGFRSQEQRRACRDFMRGQQPSEWHILSQ
jgi:surface antigen